MRNVVLFEVLVDALADADQAVLLAASEPQQFQLLPGGGRVEHDLKGEGMESNIHNGWRWHHGAWIQYTLDPRGAREAVLSVTYSGDDRDREFDILVNGAVIATQRLTGEEPNHFIEKRYPTPSDVLQSAGNGRLTVRFVAKRWLAGGGAL